MQRVSSNATLFFKYFVPIFWLVFFGALTVALFAYQEQLVGQFQGIALRWIALVFYISGAILFYFLLFPLKRVEMDADFAYVTNYFKTFRYPWHNVAKISESRFWVFLFVTMEFKTPGNFGKKIRFMGSRRLYDGFWAEHPEVADGVVFEK